MSPGKFPELTCKTFTSPPSSALPLCFILSHKFIVMVLHHAVCVCVSVSERESAGEKKVLFDWWKWSPNQQLWNFGCETHSQCSSSCVWAVVTA